MKKEHGYSRQKHPILIRAIAIWRVITCRNIILIDFKESTKEGRPSRIVRSLYRTDYNRESEELTLMAELQRAITRKATK